MLSYVGPADPAVDYEVVPLSVLFPLSAKDRILLPAPPLAVARPTAGASGPR